ncbi:MAG: translation initiation factor [cyanobacterium endosymbiont of Rhopalodia musculus]|uniref:translation initiation factor n=1 Tax=cyanobacterium endosymbiont of Epithemia clementina EcSB TaxID=3034674 RepID=UPI0024803DB8|nr:translation initiation factor [cyanobacterium endosymbiont of Epithemia clementina EcSB]WGT67941.1 translation initiation factor [cyanobacterium endosymbiont of Epithemia clementina EcSB]
MSSKRQYSSEHIAYQEFGLSSNPEVLESQVKNLLPQQQNILVKSTRSGRKGKTVTVITGFQHSAEELVQLLKQLKNQCGSGGTIKDNTLEIQGNHCQKIVTVLSQLGYKVKISGG